MAKVKGFKSNELLKLKEEFQSNFTKVFKEELKSFFDKFPTVYAVSWRQYTPYFNDGEACEFRKPDLDELEVNLVESNDFISFYDFQDANLLKEMKKELHWFDEIEEEYFRILFGDHAQISINNNLTITVESYTDHD